MFSILHCVTREKVQRRQPQPSKGNLFFLILISILSFSHLFSPSTLHPLSPDCQGGCLPVVDDSNSVPRNLQLRPPVCGRVPQPMPQVQHQLSCGSSNPHIQRQYALDNSSPSLPHCPCELTSESVTAGFTSPCTTGRRLLRCPRHCSMLER